MKPLLASKEELDFAARVKYFRDLFADKEQAAPAQPRQKIHSKHAPQPSGQKLGEKKPKPEIPSFRIG
jgi:hypothetical protein